MSVLAADRAGDLAFLEVAASLGRDIAEQAVWDGDRCNWVGASYRDGRDGNAAATYAALGPDLYDGTGGIALFLSHLSDATGDGDARRTALGAIRQALSVSHERGSTSPSVYTGTLGVALAAAGTGTVLGVDGLVDEASRLAHAEVADPGRVEFDLLLGQAGSIVGLLALGRVLGDARLVERAAEVGHALVRKGRRVGGRRSWAARRVRGAAPLTGLSHGAAGAGLALLELAWLTGDSSYRQAADEAFAYERSVFDAEERNWPDYRAWRSSSGPPEATSFATFWCHGAPGIALSRLRSVELFGDPGARAEAHVALATTERAVLSALWNRTGNFSLCHGLAGNAEILLEGTRVLRSGCADGVDVARRVAEAGIERYGSLRSWPCGAHGGQTPSLFLGLAGVGLFYLRLARPSVPSMLLVRPEAFGPL